MHGVFYVLERSLYGMVNLKAIIQELKLVIFDVDGVFTNGSVYLSEDGKEMMKFSRIDGRGIKLLKQQGFKTAVITSEDTYIVKFRMEKLKIDEIYMGILDKSMIYNQLKKKFKLSDENICYLGDDTNDLEILKIVGLSCSPKNAQEIVKQNSKYVSEYKGGKGFVRDVCNLIVENIQK